MRASLISGQFHSRSKNRNFGAGRFIHDNSIIYPLIREIETKRAKNSAGLNRGRNSNPDPRFLWVGLNQVSFQIVPSPGELWGHIWLKNRRKEGFSALKDFAYFLARNFVLVIRRTRL
jgi:hypothetical protein